MISGTHAADIREYARSLWRGFDTRGLAPKMWSKALRSVEDECIRDMENQWPVLWYCENHWKANYIATKNYPLWYKTHHKDSSEADDIEAKEPLQKKCKTTMIEDDNAGDCQMEPETDMDSDGDRNTAVPHRLGLRRTFTRDP